MLFTMAKIVCDIFFHLREMGMQTLGTILKKALLLGSERVNMLTRAVVAALCVVKNHSKVTSFVFFLYLKQIVSTPIPF